MVITRLNHGDKLFENNNRIVVEEGSSVRFIDSRIVFVGSNNVLYVEKGANIKNAILRFSGNNSVIYIGASSRPYQIVINAFSNSVFYCGKGNSFNGKLTAVLSEGRHIFIGNDNMCSFGISMRVADPHLIYSCASKERINPSKSIYIGDHCWIGQNVNILKGVQVGSGSIIAGEALLTKKVKSNSTFGGSPAKLLKDDIFWRRPSVHAYTTKETEESMYFDSNEFIYKLDETTQSFGEINRLIDSNDVEGRLELLKEIASNTNKNRFFIQ